MTKNQIIPALADIESVIRLIRGHRVILDADIAALYGVPTKVLLQSLRRNRDRFPEDFVFQLTAEEANNLRSQIVTSSSKGHGGRRYAPYAFTQEGVAMLSGVLRSQQAVRVNIEIMRTFVRLRQALSSNAAIARRLTELERRYDAKFRAVFDAIRSLMLPAVSSKKKIGFKNE